ncbi:MAG: rRNA maturation RNase YbeY [Armatimonadota bacterium]
MQVLIRNEQNLPVRVQHLRNLTKKVLQLENCNENIEVSILLCDDSYISELNYQYREVEGPTDVLSFSLIEGDENFDIEDEKLLGDIVISVETAQRQANEAGHSLEKEIDTLLVHGILHLLGYDHCDENQEEELFTLQNKYLNT